jgi:hypothetical protein
MQAMISTRGKVLGAAVAATAAGLLICGLSAQAADPAPAAPVTPKSAAQFDMTGRWVSIISEDWMYRMIVPPKGDIGSVPVNDTGKKATAAWDPAKDVAAGETCKAYGAAGLTRMPGRVNISWVDDKTIRIDFDAGIQTRLLHFAENLPAVGYTASEPPSRLLVKDAGEPSLQGYSRAVWHKQAQSLGMGPMASTKLGAHGGSLAVVTTNMKAGYLQLNGVPYSSETILKEFFDLIELPSGEQLLIVTSIVEDPQNLTQPFVTSTQFKRERDASKWDPRKC